MKESSAIKAPILIKTRATDVAYDFIENMIATLKLESGQVIPMQFKKVMEVFAIVLVPVTIGMLVRNRSNAIAHRCWRTSE